MDGEKYTHDFLNSKRLLGDPIADDFIEKVFQDDEKKHALQQWLSQSPENSDLQFLIDIYPDEKFLHQANHLPEWADIALMESGSAFFVKHSQMIMSLLGLLSLPYCYTAANGAMVLYLSGRIRTQTTKRLYDTAIFVWEVMAPKAFDREGNAYSEILKVRLIHAIVRYYMLKSEKWDHAWGFPINQEDMAGTNLSFSLLVIRGLRKLGFKVGDKDENAFLHLWAVIGYFTGLDENMIPENVKMANTLDVAIKEREFRVSDHGKELTQALITHIMSVNKSKATLNDITGLMRYLLDDDVADMLAINPVKLQGYKLTLLKMLNILKSFKWRGDIHQIYQKSYSAFKLLNPELKTEN